MAKTRVVRHPLVEEREPVASAQLKRGQIVMVGWDDAPDERMLLLGPVQGTRSRSWEALKLGATPSHRLGSLQYEEEVQADQVMKIIGHFAEMWP